MRIKTGILCIVLLSVACGSDEKNTSNNATTNNTNNTTIPKQNNAKTNNNTHNNTTPNTTNGQTNTTNNNNPSHDTYQHIVERGKTYFDVAEKFNRYYTDASWKPTRVIYVDLETNASNFSMQSYDSPISVDTALQNIQAGDLVFIKKTAKSTNVNIRLEDDQHGTYDAPIVFYGERNSTGELAVHMECATSGSNAASSCFNLEAVDYVAIDGFEMKGGNYGIRAVGSGYAQADHQVGIAILNNRAFDQHKDPFFSGQSDWLAIEANTASGGGSGDGHGIYLSNGSDWNIIRYNEVFGNENSDFQINADPISTCEDEGIAYSEIACNGDAKDGVGQGASDYMTISRNFFHDGLGSGPNLTSVRNSYFGQNIVGPYVRHGTSFWQETPEAKLGSANNEITANLFVGHRSHILQFVEHSTNNKVNNNIFLALNEDGTAIDTSIEVIETDDTVSENTYSKNIYFSGPIIGHALDSSEEIVDTLPPGLFPRIYAREGHPEDWKNDPKVRSLGNWTPPIMAKFPSPWAR